VAGKYDSIHCDAGIRQEHGRSPRRQSDVRSTRNACPCVTRV
jgi:hypothetical protein